MSLMVRWEKQAEVQVTLGRPVAVEQGVPAPSQERQERGEARGRSREERRRGSMVVLTGLKEQG